MPPTVCHTKKTKSWGTRPSCWSDFRLWLKTMDMHVGMFEHFRPMYCQCAIVTFTTDLHGCAIGETNRRFRSESQAGRSPWAIKNDGLIQQIFFRTFLIEIFTFNFKNINMHNYSTSAYCIPMYGNVNIACVIICSCLFLRLYSVRLYVHTGPYEFGTVVTFARLYLCVHKTQMKSDEYQQSEMPCEQVERNMFA